MIRSTFGSRPPEPGPATAGRTTGCRARRIAGVVRVTFAKGATSTTARSTSSWARTRMILRRADYRVYGTGERTPGSWLCDRRRWALQRGHLQWRQCARRPSVRHPRVAELPRRILRWPGQPSAALGRRGGIGRTCPRRHGVCALSFRVPARSSSRPFERSGFAKTDIAADPLHTCLPAVESMQVTGAYLHEPPAIRDSLIEFHTGAGGSGSGHGRQPCPAIVLPMPGEYSGTPTTTGVGPIIGVIGVRAR